MQYQKFEGRRPHPSYNPKQHLQFKGVLNSEYNSWQSGAAQRRKLTAPLLRGLLSGFIAAILTAV